MSVKLEIPASLNEQQVMMLRLLKDPLPDADFQQVRRLAVKLLAKKLDEVIEVWGKKNHITGETYQKQSKGHFAGRIFGYFNKSKCITLKLVLPNRSLIIAKLFNDPVYHYSL